MEETRVPAIVFGAAGFIGGVVAEGIAGEGFRPVMRLSSADADLRDPAQTRALEPRLPAGAVWVLAAAVTPDRPCPPLDGMMDNLCMARNLAEALERAAPAHAVFLSSIDVYGREAAEPPLNEDSPLRPSSYYAVSKAASEMMLGRACEAAGIPFTVLRLPGVYGPGDTHGGPVARFVRAALSDEPITVHGDGLQRRDLLYVHDVPRIIAAVHRLGVTGTFNVVTGRSVSLNEMLACVAELKGGDLEVRYEPAAQFDLVFEKPALARRVPDLEFTSLENGICETYAAMRRTMGGAF